MSKVSKFLLSAAAVATVAAGLTTAGVSSASAEGGVTIRQGTAKADYTDPAGNVWKKDSGFVGGYQVSNVTSAGIAGTDASPLYQNEHWGMSKWSAQVPNGTYDVTLKMAETYFSGKNIRVFSVTAEGQRVVGDLDLFAAAGKNAAVDKKFQVKVTDGSIDLGFSATKNNAKVDGILVQSVGSTGSTPVVTPNPRPTQPTPTPSVPAPTTPAPAPTTPAPTTPAPAPSTPATAGTWKSGMSGVGATSGQAGSWRGQALQVSSTWADNPTAAANFWQLDKGAEFGSWNQDLDIAVGALGSGESWSNAAKGAYDARWAASLTTLKAKWGNRSGTPYIRFAHEMNGNWYAWSVNKSNSADFIAGWKRYRALQQQIFPASKLVFSVNRESVGNGMDWRQTFPGAQYVDAMGVDYYNQYPYAGTAAVFNSSIQETDGYGAPKGLATHLAYAKSVGLPLVVSEWAGHAENGDSPAFIQGMHDFFQANAGNAPGKVAYEVYFNVDIDNHRWLITDGTKMPNSAAKYREVF
ncbi:malectin domain-containing carbohydrate-binding protein [Kineococcus rhizosphaerae]|uniref:Glycosyl hydrolase family 26 n=1 Tax=Kineococcus rhizosphaerae TaxID=559628 RepID=A0A2T0R5H8_9ACTN|nr:malectin domain-containing carbohydrate-binding protein [Kineococcus rhizosphaerae]PRY16021.1 glycosyl hydrolase family 26 [Kineococcus rhizosphaerae]